MFITHRLKIRINPSGAADVDVGKLLQSWTNQGMLSSSRFWVTNLFNFLLTLMATSVFFSVVVIITSEEQEILNQNILMMITTTLFFGFKARMFGRIHPKLPCLETRIAEPPKQVYRSSMWHMKDIGQGYIFCQRVFIDLSSC